MRAAFLVSLAVVSPAFPAVPRPVVVRTVRAVAAQPAAKPAPAAASALAGLPAPPQTLAPSALPTLTPAAQPAPSAPAPVLAGLTAAPPAPAESRADWSQRLWTALLGERPRGGLIDSHRFQDNDGRHYLYWKEDANSLTPKEKTGLFVQELSPDGLSLLGPRQRLIENDLLWEGDLVEAPWVMRRGRYYYLFYSANNFGDDTYSVGVARALSPFGTFKKLGRPVLRSNERWAGPGHNSIVRRPNVWDRVREALERPFPGPGLARRLLAPLLTFLDGLGGGDIIIYHAWEAGRLGGEAPFVDALEAPFPSGQNPRTAGRASTTGRQASGREPCSGQGGHPVQALGRTVVTGLLPRMVILRA